MAVGRVLSAMITGRGRESWVQISSCIIWMFPIPNYIAVWKNEIEISLKARLKFPKRKWIDTSLCSNRRPKTSLYNELQLASALCNVTVTSNALRVSDANGSIDIYSGGLRD